MHCAWSSLITAHAWHPLGCNSSVSLLTEMVPLFSMMSNTIALSISMLHLIWPVSDMFHTGGVIKTVSLSVWEGLCHILLCFHSPDSISAPFPLIPFPFSCHELAIFPLKRAITLHGTLVPLVFSPQPICQHFPLECPKVSWLAFHLSTWWLLLMLFLSETSQLHGVPVFVHWSILAFLKVVPSLLGTDVSHTRS